MPNENIPKDPVMLLSYINLKLRDYYPTLEELCKALEIDQKGLCHQLERIDYTYDAARNQFI